MTALRELETGDFAVALALLCEGFPDRVPAYWRRALELLARQVVAEGLPRMGLLLEDAGEAVGIMLLPTMERRINLSSWYIRPSHRSHAMAMMQKLMRLPGVTLLNLTPQPHVARLMEALGFKPYTAGQLWLTPLDAWRGGGRVRVERDGVLLLRDGAGEMRAEFRRRWLKRAVPAAQFVAGDPERLAAAAGPVMRGLMRRGFGVALLDWPAGVAAPAGRFFAGREVRRARGVAPAVGELLGTELAVFGP